MVFLGNFQMLSECKASYEKWRDDIFRLKLKQRTCYKLSNKEELQQQPNEKCGCGRLRTSHSYSERPLEIDNVNEWGYGDNTTLTKIETFGVFYNSYEQCRTKVK